MPIMLRLPGRLRRVSRAVRGKLPEPNFITLHYAWFIFVPLILAIVFWASSTPLNSISFTDSLFLTVSAISEAGLNTINLSQINTFQQVILFLLVFSGSPIFVSGIIVLVRLQAFEKAFRDIKGDRPAGQSQEKKTGLSTTGRLVPWRISKPRTVSEDIGGKAPTINVPPNEHEKESFAASTGTTDGRSSMADERGIKRGSVKDTGASKVDVLARGRQTQTTDNRTPLQCPSQSPTGRDSEHEDHAPGPSVQHIGFEQGIPFPVPRVHSPENRIHHAWFSFSGVGASSPAHIRTRSTSAGGEGYRSLSRASRLPSTYDQTEASKITAIGWISRNSQFHGLTLKERETLGGREYRCVFFLSFLVPFYLIIWQLLGAVALGAWINNNRPSTTYENGIKPWWAGVFMAVSAFNNSGMSLLDANMVAFQNSAFVLVSMSLFILAGNTAYPIFLRSAIWTMWKILPEDDPRWSEDKQTLRFLLDHPRRVYTNLFPSRHTWWLAGALVLLNGIDWAFFELLSIGDKDIDTLPAVTRVLGGLFQAFAVRSGGFYVVPIPTLRLSLQFLYAIMMYISVYPVTITMRNSNVYEERSLGIFAEDLESESPHGPDCNVQTPTTPANGPISGIRRRLTGFAQVAAPAPLREKASFFVRQQLRSQLAHDAWFSVLAIFLILIIENSQLEGHPLTFTVFDVMFEVVSAYATVGLSVGVPNNAYSFSGSWHVLSKLILCAVMIRGRHRGLPVAIDHAIQLPGRKLWDAEDEDGNHRLDRMERSDKPLTPMPSTSPPAVVLNSPTALRTGNPGGRAESGTEEV